MTRTNSHLALQRPKTASRKHNRFQPRTAFKSPKPFTLYMQKKLVPVSKRDYHDISLMLASVLEEVGVNQRIVMKRREIMLLEEKLETALHRIQDMNNVSYRFGSQSEGSTTLELNSDTDTLICISYFNVIQHISEWERDHFNLLAIQDEDTTPGYCMLQILSNDAPVPLRESSNENHFKYNGDKILLKNSVPIRAGEFREGPAIRTNVPGLTNWDHVNALPYKTMPTFLKTWLDRQLLKGKVTHEMKRYIESHPCYVVPVGKKTSPCRDLEWRISTSHAERCIMFNLNITQMQCYVMLKVISNKYLTPPSGKVISSFMCKNTLLLCIEDKPNAWYPNNLLNVFKYCLFKLQVFILQERCPHFINNENNLMAKKFTADIKNWLLKTFQYLMQENIKPFYYDIQLEDIGRRLKDKLFNLYPVPRYYDISTRISGILVRDLAKYLGNNRMCILQAIHRGKATFSSIIMTLIQLNLKGSERKQAASHLLSPLICSSLGSVVASKDIGSVVASKDIGSVVASKDIGSVVASKDIHQGHTVLVSPAALSWLNLGLNSDVASSRLKLASVHYCSGNFNKAEALLRYTEEKYNVSTVECACGCYPYPQEVGNPFKNYALECKSNEEVIRHAFAFCVSFIPEEIDCQPQELQYEMFRSTQDELSRRNIETDGWMVFAVVDSLPYLYFLEYKIYQQLQKHREKQQALTKLEESLNTKHLGHKDTAFNLLGQCLMQEKRHEEALRFYKKSLHVRPDNNASRIHICILLNKILSKVLTATDNPDAIEKM